MSERKGREKTVDGIYDMPLFVTEPEPDEIVCDRFEEEKKNPNKKRKGFEDIVGSPSG